MKNNTEVHILIAKWELNRPTGEWYDFLIYEAGVGYYEDDGFGYICFTVLAASEELAEQAASVARASGAFSIIRCEGEIEYP